MYIDYLEKREAIAVVGLGYVGLPLVCQLASKFKILGFDIDQKRIAELIDGFDRTGVVKEPSKIKNKNITFSPNPNILGCARLFIVTVPTPIDSYKKPDLTFLINASNIIGKYIRRGSIVVYESTVYPGLTESICKDEIERASRLKYRVDFELGYSPERINPGDEKHTIDSVKKVVSGSTPEVANLLSHIYGEVIPAGAYKAPSIRVAEAAKIIENTQRDINIALVNELALLFDQIGLDTNDVLDTAATKWNFLRFRPGLVGGHCIGIDPYYLTYLAESVSFSPQVILAGRRINDNLAKYIGRKTLELALKQSDKVLGRKLVVVILGVTFKPDIGDLRNTKIAHLGRVIEGFGADVIYVDPVVDRLNFENEFGKRLTDWKNIDKCDAIIYAVPHKEFNDRCTIDEIEKKLVGNKVLIDVCNHFSRDRAKELNINMWRL